MTYAEVLPIWWSFTWRALLVGGLAGLVLGGVGGLIAGLLGRPEVAGQWGSILGYLVSIPASLWALRAAINKHQLNRHSVLKELVRSFD